MPTRPIRPEVNLPAIEDSLTFYKKLLDSLHDGVYFVDADRKITYWNKGAEQLTGYAVREAVGRRCPDDFLAHVDEQGRSLCLKGCPLVSTISDGECRDAELYLRHKSGHRVSVSVRVAPIMDNAGTICGAVEVFTDITAKKAKERRAGKLEVLAFRDALTGVSNHRYIEFKVKQAIQEFEQFGRNIGLAEIDVDHLKQVNDTYGHSIGDVVLRAVCSTLTHNLRRGDTVGRLRGEKFLVIVADVNPTALIRIMHEVEDARGQFCFKHVI
jgi:PAS domain S-box-containing protein